MANRKQAVAVDRSAPQSATVGGPPTGKPSGRPPGVLIAKIHDARFYSALRRVADLASLGAPLWLVARALSGVTYETLRVWRDAGEALLEALEAMAYEELRVAVTVFMKPSDKGGSAAPLMLHTAERLAKFAMVLAEGEAAYIQYALAAGNKAVADGDGRLAIAMLHRKYPRYRDRPVKAVSLDGVPDATAKNPSGGASGVIMKRITTKIPSNGFRPGESFTDDDDIQSDQKRGRVRGKGATKGAGRPVRTKPAVSTVQASTGQAHKPNRVGRGGYVRIPR